jgi:hypothetical protein
MQTLDIEGKNSNKNSKVGIRERRSERKATRMVCTCIHSIRQGSESISREQAKMTPWCIISQIELDLGFLLILTILVYDPCGSSWHQRQYAEPILVSLWKKKPKISFTTSHVWPLPSTVDLPRLFVLCVEDLSPMSRKRLLILIECACHYIFQGHAYDKSNILFTYLDSNARCSVQWYVQNVLTDQAYLERVKNKKSECTHCQ